MIRALLLALVLATLGGVLLVAALLLALNMHGEERYEELIEQGLAPAPASRSAAQVARGAYLAQAGGCEHCHTARGGARYAGGRPIETPFGAVYSRNLTPDPRTGLGGWTPLHFRQALHYGRSRSGQMLYPTCPYPNYTQVSAEDVDAIHAYLQSLPPVVQPNRPGALRFPFGSQIALALWRALYFRAGHYAGNPARDEAWNRGAYLAQGLGHCSACHAARNLLGSISGADDVRGGLMPSYWYAPSLRRPQEAGLADWPVEDVVKLLQTGQAPGATVIGPMAQVVLRNTQHLTEADLQALATYLRALPPQPGTVAALRPPAARDSSPYQHGARLYAEHCTDCHGAAGEGATGAYPPLAGNRAVVLEPPVNVLRLVLEGGFPPATAGNPRPYGMPPFAAVLGDEDIADLASYIRGAWGNRGSAVNAEQVQRARAAAAP